MEIYCMGKHWEPCLRNYTALCVGLSCWVWNSFWLWIFTAPRAYNIKLFIETYNSNINIISEQYNLWKNQSFKRIIKQTFDILKNTLTNQTSSKHSKREKSHETPTLYFICKTPIPKSTYRRRKKKKIKHTRKSRRTTFSCKTKDPPSPLNCIPYFRKTITRGGRIGRSYCDSSNWSESGP